MVSEGMDAPGCRLAELRPDTDIEKGLMRNEEDQHPGVLMAIGWLMHNRVERCEGRCRREIQFRIGSTTGLLANEVI